MGHGYTKQSVRILGPIEAGCDSRLDLGGPRQHALFAYLLLHANRAVPADVLVDALWGAARPVTDNRLQMAVARLRKALAPLADTSGLTVRTVRNGYLLTIDSSQLDSEVFADRVQYGLQCMQEDEPALALSVLSEALSLWRGPPLADVSYEDFAQGPIRRLEELRRIALEVRIDAELRLGRHRELIGELRRLLAEHPTCERITAQLMLALYRSDRQVDALDAYESTRIQLSTQLGLEPGPTLKALQASILKHESSLMGRASSALRSAHSDRSSATLKPRSGSMHPLFPSDVLGATAVERRCATRREIRSTFTSHTPEIRWRGASRHWHHESWTGRSQLEF